MATHRSLNKLEFKAHMSIHNSVAVPEEEIHESTAFTKDRLGKKHLLADETGGSRIGSLRNKAPIVMLILLLAGSVLTPLCLAEPQGEHAILKKKGPNVQVSSSDPEVRSVDSWMNKDDDKPVFYQDGSTTVGFNGDGDPNVSNRF